MSGYRCPLGAIQPKQMDTEAIKREAFYNDGFLVVHVDDPRLDWVEQQFVKNIGMKLHGKGQGVK